MINKTEFAAADTVNWEDIIFNLIELRDAAEEDLRLRFNRLESEAWLETVNDESDSGWYACSVLKHLEMMKLTSAVLRLLPSKNDCMKAIDQLTGN